MKINPQGYAGSNSVHPAAVDVIVGLGGETQPYLPHIRLVSLHYIKSATTALSPQGIVAGASLTG